MNEACEMDGASIISGGEASEVSEVAEVAEAPLDTIAQPVSDGIIGNNNLTSRIASDLAP
ncbi:hypothetical protein GCM10023157_19330 [Gluconacetobacter asukensis]